MKLSEMFDDSPSISLDRCKITFDVQQLAADNRTVADLRGWILNRVPFTYQEAEHDDEAGTLEFFTAHGEVTETELKQLQRLVANQGLAKYNPKLETFN
ncbi:MAG: hypothetical protein JXR12_05260 [Neptunomonas phycophila]|uniref:hypothetical protein n=1 Tax=Neptunomonas phycophila TaxID=1572645 RepID=UPI003B8E26B5